MIALDTANPFVLIEPADDAGKIAIELESGQEYIFSTSSDQPKSKAKFSILNYNNIEYSKSSKKFKAPYSGTYYIDYDFGSEDVYITGGKLTGGEQSSNFFESTNGVSAFVEYGKLSF